MLKNNYYYNIKKNNIKLNDIKKSKKSRSQPLLTY
jgi:hypothetical protein